MQHEYKRGDRFTTPSGDTLTYLREERSAEERKAVYVFRLASSRSGHETEVRVNETMTGFLNRCKLITI
jgi:hypothetical protein